MMWFQLQVRKPPESLGKGGLEQVSAAGCKGARSIAGTVRKKSWCEKDLAEPDGCRSGCGARAVEDAFRCRSGHVGVTGDGQAQGRTPRGQGMRI